MSQPLVLNDCTHTRALNHALAPKVTLRHNPAGADPMVALDSRETCFNRQGLGFDELTCHLKENPFLDPAFAHAGTYQIDISQDSLMLLVDYGWEGVTDSRASIELRVKGGSGTPFVWTHGGTIPVGEADTNPPLMHGVFHQLWKQESIWVDALLEVVFRLHITCAPDASLPLHAPVRWQVNSMTISTVPSSQ